MLTFSFTPKEKLETQSNMVVLEVSLPSGFTAETDLLYTLTKIKNVKKVETKNGETVIVLYFDNLVANEPICPIFDAFRAHTVTEQKPVPIVVYDYYDSCKFISNEILNSKRI